MHGGSAPQTQAAAARRLAREQVAGELVRLGHFDDDASFDIIREFELLLIEDRAEVFLYRSLVANLAPGYRGRTWLDGDKSAGSVELEAGIAGPNHLGDGAPHVLVVQYERARERLARHLKMAHDAGIAERQVEISEALGEQIVHVLKSLQMWVLDRLRDAGAGADVIEVIEAEYPKAAASRVRAMAESGGRPRG